MPKVDVYNMQGKKVSDVELSEAVFGIEPNENIVHSALVNYLANQRQGTQSTKTRAEVSGGGRKPWRQKGTGRARQGSIRAPQWIKGGIALGPKPRSYKYTVNKKERRLAIKSLLSSKVLEKELSKTKTLTPTQSMLFVISHENRHSYQSYHVHQPEANLAVFETIKSDLFRKELSTDEFDEYRKNYFFDGMENDANCWGYIFLEDVLHKNKIDKSMYEIEIDTNLINLHQQQTVGYKTNGNKKRQMEYFDVYHLSEIVKKRPEYVNEYPMLQIMFTKSGEVKPNQELFKGLIDKENHLDMDKYEVARDFVLKAMDQEIEKQQVEKMSTEEKFDYFIVVFTCLHQELKKLKNATRVIGKDERLVDAYQHIMPKRIKVVRKLLQEINKHAELIDDLASLERYGEYGRDLWMAERGIEDLINSIKSPIKESSEQIPSDIAVELLEVSQSEVKPNAARRGV